MQFNLDNLKKDFSKLELTKAQRDRAKELYTNICNFLMEKTGLEIDFYAQGSFATRTVVRPYVEGDEKLYDVDVICEVQNINKKFSSNELMDIFEEALKDSRYSKHYDRWDKCFTITYQETDIDEFSIDIIPAVPASEDAMNDILNETPRKELVNTSIAIPNVTEKESNWIYNNPRGYAIWFDEKTHYFENQFRIMREQSYTASIEELPEDYATNMLRNVIKMLKRSRDVYFSKTKSKNKPVSIIINTLVAGLSNKFITFNFENEYDLLITVVKELSQLKYFVNEEAISRSLSKGYVMAEVISKENGKWILKNPANGLDNILSSWNESSVASIDFFDWIDHLDEIINILTSETNPETRKVTELYNVLNIVLPEHIPVNLSVDEKKARPWGGHECR